MTNKLINKLGIGALTLALTGGLNAKINAQDVRIVGEGDVEITDTISKNGAVTDAVLQKDTIKNKFPIIECEYFEKTKLVKNKIYDENGVLFKNLKYKIFQLGDSISYFKLSSDYDHDGENDIELIYENLILKNKRDKRLFMKDINKTIDFFVKYSKNKQSQKPYFPIKTPVIK